MPLRAYFRPGHQKNARTMDDVFGVCVVKVLSGVRCSGHPYWIVFHVRSLRVRVSKAEPRINPDPLAMIAPA